MLVVQWVVDNSGAWRCQVVEQAAWRRGVRRLIDLGCPFGRHWLCNPPGWAFEIGRPWRPWPQETLNLGNLWWTAGFWLLNHPSPGRVVVSAVIADTDVPARVRRRQ